MFLDFPEAITQVNEPSTPSQAQNYAFFNPAFALLTGFKHLNSPVKNFLRRDVLHTAMINWTFSEHTGSTMDQIADHMCLRRKRTDHMRIGWAKNRQEWAIQRRSDIGRPRVIGNNQRTPGQKSNTFGQAGGAGQDSNG